MSTLTASSGGEARADIGFRLARLVFDMTGVSLGYSAESLATARLATMQTYLEDIVQQRTLVIPAVKAQAATYIDELQRFLVEPLGNSSAHDVAVSGIHLTDAFRASYWGRLINQTLARIFTLDELVHVKAATELLQVPRSTLIYLQEQGMLYGIVVDGRTYYVRAQVEAIKARRDAELALSRRSRPGRRALAYRKVS